MVQQAGLALKRKLTLLKKVIAADTEIFETPMNVWLCNVESHLMETLKIHGGVDSIAGKLATSYGISTSDSRPVLSIKNEVLGKNKSILESIPVIRECFIECMSVNKLVPGDIVLLNKGDLVPANGYFVYGLGSSNVLVNEYNITGKSEAVRVSSENPFLFYGNRVVDGSCMMFVTAIGKTTLSYKMIGMLIHNLQSLLYFQGGGYDFYYKKRTSSCYSSSGILLGPALNRTPVGDGRTQISPTETAPLTVEPPSPANFTLPGHIEEASTFFPEYPWMTSSDSDSESSGKFSGATIASERLCKWQNLLARTSKEYDFLISEFISVLKSGCMKDIKEVTVQIRLLTKDNSDNRLRIGRAGAVEPLVRLLLSKDSELQECVVTAILNLSLCDENKQLIASSGVVKPLVQVLKDGTPTAKENAACVIAQLSKVGNNKVVFGQSGAIPHLVSLLKNAEIHGKKDASAALYQLLTEETNKLKALQVGIIKPLLELVAKFKSGDVGVIAACLLNMLVPIAQARTTLVQEGGIPILVMILEIGSQLQKEIAVKSLLLICKDCVVYCKMVTRRKRAIRILNSLSQHGCGIAKEMVPFLCSEICPSLFHFFSI